MGKLKISDLVEAVLWLALIAFLFYHSRSFNQPIEIYKYGAAAWPRALLLMMLVVVLGQLIVNWRTGGEKTDSKLESIMIDEAEAQASAYSIKWYISTLVMFSLPFVYMNLPGMLVETDKPNDPALHKMKLICALAVIVVYLFMMMRNKVGGMIVLPLLFASMLQDFGFYSLAPLFVIGVMFLMGERRVKPYFWVMPLIIGLLLLFFVKLLYVGLPTGNIPPFYDLGNWIVTVLQ